MKTSYLFKVLIISISLTSLTACKKDCVPKENVNSGAIIDGYVIYPKSGYLTEIMNGDYLISFGDDYYTDQFEYSSDGGATRQPVDFTKYSILAYPMKITCNASFERDVQIDPFSGTIVYSIHAKQCGSQCDEVRTVENYVLIPAQSGSSFVQYNPSIETVK